jgi:hypothetical protein
VLLRGIEVDVLAAVRRVGAGHLALGALAGQQRLRAHAAVGAPEADHDPVQNAVAGHLGALGAEDPRALVQVLAADITQASVLPHHELDHGVQQRLGLAVAGQVLLPHLRLGPLVQHDQHAPLQCGAGGRGHRGQEDRGVDADAARHPHERAAVPRVPVPAREHVVGRHHPSEVGLHELRMPLAGDREREHDRTVLDRGALADGAVDLIEPGALRHAGEQALGQRPKIAAVGRRERREIQAAEVRELPARAALERGQLERRRLSQWSPPSGARSGGSSPPRTPSGAP